MRLGGVEIWLQPLLAGTAVFHLYLDRCDLYRSRYHAIARSTDSAFNLVGIALALLEISPVSLQNSVIGAMAGYLCLWSVYHLFRLMTGKEGMGYGDFKLLAALGAWLGWQSLLMIILLSSVVGLIFGLIQLRLQKQGIEKAFPFGPYLAIAGWVALMWGESLMSWYFSVMMGA